MSDTPAWLQERLDQYQAEQSGKSHTEVEEMLKQRVEHTFDPANAPVIKHVWHDHGLKQVCYDAGHKMHEVWMKH